MIAQKVSFAFFNNLAMSALGYVSLFFVARLMGPTAIGMVAFALAYVGIFSSFADLGFGSAHIKRVSEGRDFGRCNGTYLTVTVILSAVMFLVVILTILIPKLSHRQYFVSKEHEIVLYIILVSAVIGNITMFFNITFGARKETAKQSIPLLIGKIVEVVGKVLVALLGFGVIFLAGANLLSVIALGLCFIWLFRNYPVRKPNMQYFKSYVKFAIPVMFIGILSTVAQNMDKVMIQFFISTEQVGYYAAGQSIALVIMFITIASKTLIFPTISYYHSKNKIGRIRFLSNEAERYLSMVFFPVVMFIILFSNPICRILLGRQFSQSAIILAILSLVTLIDGISQPYALQLGATDRIVLAARISATVFMLDIILNFIFIPKHLFNVPLLGMGMKGAALSTLISMSLGAIIFRFYAYKITSTKPNLLVLRNLTAALIMGLSLFLISQHVNTISFHNLVFYAFIGFIIYFVSLVLIRGFGRKELDLFLKIVNPLALKNYIASEIKSGYVAKY